MVKGFTISRVGHVGIHVTDLDRSLVWYRDILGAHADRAMAVWGWGDAFMRFRAGPSARSKVDGRLGPK